MKTKKALRRLIRIRVLAGCVLVAAVFGAEVWMVGGFAGNCARHMAAENLAAGFPGVENSVTLR
jgi:hypothetical protein